MLNRIGKVRIHIIVETAAYVGREFHCRGHQQGPVIGREALQPRFAEAILHQSIDYSGVEIVASADGGSLSTAKRIKAAGILAEATIQFKKTIVFDEEKVVELLGASNSKWSYLAKTRLKSKKM